MVDTIVVGRFLGVDALAGVGSTGAVNFLVLGFCMGICAGFAVPVAQKFGEKDYEGMRRYVGNMIWLGAAFALVITLVTTVLCRKILVWMGNPADTIEYAYNYIFYIFLGIPASMLYNLLSGVIRAMGDSRTPLYFLIFSSLLNIVLDIIFIVAFHWGVMGAGLATVIAQLISGLLCLVLIAKKFPLLHITRDDIKPRKRYLLRLASMGVPMGLQYSVTAIGSVILQTAVNGLGTVAMAAMTTGNKIGMFCSCAFDAIGTAAATFAGQNVGANRIDRVRQGVKVNAIYGSIYAVVIFGVLYFWGGNLARLFLDAEEMEVIALCQKMLVRVAAFYIPLMFVNLLRFTIQGMGYSEIAVVAGALEMVARAGIGLGLVPFFGFDAVCFAGPLAWVLADLFLFPCYFVCLKKVAKKKRL